MYELYTNNKVKFSDCIISVRDNISLLPNHKKSKDIENRLNTRTFKEIILKNKIETLPSCYDIVLIDNTPFAGVTLNNSLGMSDYYLGVVDNCGDALHGLERISEIADDVRDCHLNQNLKPVGILMNDFDKTSNISKQYINQLQDQYKELIFDTRIYHSVKYKSAILDNKSIYELDKNLGLNFDSLYQELVSRLSIRV
jgi:chromosome partitioning protein